MAGIATQSAVTVVMSAPETPGAIDTRLGEPATATPVNASITPQTVPSNPRNGEPLTAVASKIICASKASAVSPTARSMAALTAHICAGEILSAISSRARNVSSTSGEPSKWNVISSQPARYTLNTGDPGKRAFVSNSSNGC